MENTAVFLATLVLTKVITYQEAEALQMELKNKRIPREWQGVISQVEQIIKRNII